MSWGQYYSWKRRIGYATLFESNEKKCALEKNRSCMSMIRDNLIKEKYVVNYLKIGYLRSVNCDKL